jgi:hypothetical protein
VKCTSLASNASGKEATMKKIRYYLAAIALVVIMSGSALLGVGAGSIANAASSQHISTAAMAGKSTQAVVLRRLGWCPTVGIAC